MMTRGFDKKYLRGIVFKEQGLFSTFFLVNATNQKHIFTNKLTENFK